MHRTTAVVRPDPARRAVRVRGSANSGGTTTAGTTPGATATPGSPTAAGGSGTGTTTDPLTGVTGGAATDAVGVNAALAVGVPLTVDPNRSDASQATALAWLTGLALALAVLTPPLLIRRFSRR